MDVLIPIFREIFELLVSRVSRDDKVYKLQIALSRMHRKLETMTYLSCGRLSTFIHPPTGEHRVLVVVRWEVRVLSENRLLCMGPKRPQQRLLPCSMVGT